MFQDAVNSGFEIPKILEDWGYYETSYISLSDNIPWRKQERENLIFG
mgnify:CR=1 FL=1